MRTLFLQKKQQGGFISLLMIVGFISISLSVLLGFSYHYRQSQHAVMQDLQAKQAFLFAESALLWGMRLNWDISSRFANKWQCRTFNAEPKMKSCFLWIEQGLSLLQGQAESLNGYKIYHYQWVVFSGEKNKSLGSYPGGWLDYCPLKHKECAL